MYKVNAIGVGILIAIMVTFNGVLSQYMGDSLSVLIVNMVGLLSIALVLIFTRSKLEFKKDIPRYLLCAGAIGVILVFFNNACFNELGVSLTLSLGLLGQSLASVVIDHFGFLGMEKQEFKKQKVVGFVLMIVGLGIMVLY